MASCRLFLSKAVLLCQCACRRLLLRSFSQSITLTFTLWSCSPLLCCIKQSTFLTFQALHVLSQYQFVISLLQVVFEANFHHTHVKFWAVYVQASSDTYTYLLFPTIFHRTLCYSLSNYHLNHHFSLMLCSEEWGLLGFWCTEIRSQAHPQMLPHCFPLLLPSVSVHLFFHIV